MPLPPFRLWPPGWQRPQEMQAAAPPAQQEQEQQSQQAQQAQQAANALLSGATAGAGGLPAQVGVGQAPPAQVGVQNPPAAGWQNPAMQAPTPQSMDQFAMQLGFKDVADLNKNARPQGQQQTFDPSSAPPVGVQSPAAAGPAAVGVKAGPPRTFGDILNELEQSQFGQRGKLVDVGGGMMSQDMDNEFRRDQWRNSLLMSPQQAASQIADINFREGPLAAEVAAQTLGQQRQQLLDLLGREKAGQAQQEIARITGEYGVKQEQERSRGQQDVEKMRISAATANQLRDRMAAYRQSTGLDPTPEQLDTWSKEIMSSQQLMLDAKKQLQGGAPTPTGQPTTAQQLLTEAAGKKGPAPSDQQMSELTTYIRKGAEKSPFNVQTLLELLAKDNTVANNDAAMKTLANEVLKNRSGNYKTTAELRDALAKQLVRLHNEVGPKGEGRYGAIKISKQPVRIGTPRFGQELGTRTFVDTPAGQHSFFLPHLPLAGAISGQADAWPTVTDNTRNLYQSMLRGGSRLLELLPAE